MFIPRMLSLRPVGIRSFSSSRARLNVAPLPSSKPVGAFRGGVFGFLAGSVAASASVYYYVLAEYKIANEMLSDDISVCLQLLVLCTPNGHHQAPVLHHRAGVQDSHNTNLKMFRVELLQDKSTATPGWSYAPTRGFDPTQAMAPTLGRKRNIRDAGKGGDISSRQANAIARHITELDRENARDVSIPIPVRQAKEAGARGTRAKTTSAVRRILQSQKTFRNHLDDEEAAIALGATPGSVPQNAALGKGPKAARRSETPVTRKRGTGTSTPAETDVETEEEERKPKLIKSEYDNDPLLRSYAPPMPSERLMQRLLAEPPLSYKAAGVKPPASAPPARHFCCLCGYWGKIRCKSCHLRTCSLDCYKVHEDSRCGAFF
ncbi:unnamed protein product [Penicillium salamii]|uniref:HIT-type domain-containing protein n=1 Tax=Penicillium salamii TaxID=1612424 RepID=A0A9W4NRA7_9EURO|nr:unnamed protein product [Penicillium salamii]CAG8122874.1 unnamed protein product [Penicillium salamii]CAG8227591.1 unnamed protein product [Penicillium salamii]CAG8308416.1 unnamed protein product [Penicillium salamii]CAG8330186.1 unnamed protein product [Penicillium salamii]